MPKDRPIACSLSAVEQSSRLAEMSAIGHSALISAETRGRHATLRFRPDGETRERLGAIVAAEAECCAFLDLALREETEVIDLMITAPAGAEPVLDELLAAFSGHVDTA